MISLPYNSKVSLTCDQGPFAEYTREAFHVIEIVLRSSNYGARRDSAITSGACEEEQSIRTEWIN